MPRTRARSLTREALEAGGHHVLQAEIRQSQAVALSHGRPISDLCDYRQVLDEVLALTARKAS